MVEERRNVVFQQMLRNKLISPEEKDSLSALPLKIDFSPESHREGLATYFRSYLQEFMKKWIRKNPKADGKSYNLYRDGLKIYTTIDSRLQALGENAVSDHMKNLQKEFFSSKHPGAESHRTVFALAGGGNRYPFDPNGLPQ